MNGSSTRWSRARTRRPVQPEEGAPFLDDLRQRSAADRYFLARTYCSLIATVGWWLRSGLADGVVVGDDHTGGVEALEPVDPRRRRWQRRLVPAAASAPGRGVGGVRVVALSSRDDGAVVAADDRDWWPAV